MSKQVAVHQVVSGNAATEIRVLREADHHYELVLADGRKLTIPFQHGDPKAGQNGFTMEAFLHVVADRLDRFQAGPDACAENQRAKEFCEHALVALRDRTARVELEEAEKAKAEASAG